MPADLSAHDRAFWEQVKDTRNPDERRAYLERVPDGLFAPLARARLRAAPGASGAAVAALPPAAPPPAAAREAPSGEAPARLSVAGQRALGPRGHQRLEPGVASRGARAAAQALLSAAGGG